MNKLFYRALYGSVSVMAVASLLAGCCTPRKSEPFAGSLEVESPVVSHGRSVFMRHCHECHPGGEGGLGPSLNDKPLPGFLTKIQVRNGLGVMPSFDESLISPEELNHLVAYMKALRRNKPELAAR